MTTDEYQKIMDELWPVADVYRASDYVEGSHPIGEPTNVVLENGPFR
jgi:hypothetical protein